MGVLLEQWVSCNGAWTQSEFFLRIKSKKLHRRRGCRRWLTKSELAGKYGSMDVAEAIVSAKENDPEASKQQVRVNPDCHGLDSPDTRPNV